MGYAPLMWIPWVVGALLVAGLAAWILLRRKPSCVMPYGKLRKEMMREIGDPEAARPDPPARPPGLDGRLGRPDVDKLRSLGPPTRENWQHACDVYDAVVDSIRKELEAIDPANDWYELLTPGRRAIVLVTNLENEVNNGGFDQFYLNSSGDGAALTPAALRLLGRDGVAAMVERANTQFPGGPSPSRGARLAQMHKLPDRARVLWNELDSQFFELDTGFGGLGANAGLAYVRAHEEEFFVA